MLHIVQTRFSVLHPYPRSMPRASNYWKNLPIEDADWDSPETMNRKSAEHLYSDERMEHKFRCFENLNLPSVTAAMDQVERAEWWIYVSKSPDVFPQRHLDRLLQLTAGDTRIRLIEFNFDEYPNFGAHSRSEIPKLGLDTRFSTTRIDDDDGMHAAMLREVEILSHSEDKPFVYSATWGVKCTMDTDGTLSEGPLWQHWSQHGAGLIAVDEHIWALGNHGNIGKVHPHLKIIHNREKRKSFQMMCHENFTWSSRKFK